MNAPADCAGGGWPWNAATVERALQSAGVPAEVCGGLTLESCWPFREQGHVARLRSGDGAWWGLAHFGPGAPPGAILKGIARGDVHSLGGLDAFAWRFPADPMIATGTALRDVAAGGGRGEADPLSYKPLYRCVLRRRHGGAAARYLKLYPPGQDEAAARIHEELLETGPGADVALVIPPPASRLREWRALEWAELDGDSCYAALRGPGRHAAAHRLGQALAALHRSRVAWTRVHRVDDELRTVDRWVQVAARLRPVHADRIRRTGDLVAAQGARLLPGRLVASHRDYYDKQLLMQQGRSFLLDLDTACLAEPELDLANAAAHLRLRAMQGLVPAAEPLEQAFAQAYRSSAGEIDGSRLRFYAAGTLLRLACVYALRPAWQRLCAGLAGAATEVMCDSNERRTGND